MAVVKNIKQHLVNLLGWQTHRKIIAIESDDWGTVRMASKDTYNLLLKKGYEVHKCAYNRYDALESNEDLENLFDRLLQFRDYKGNHPVITGNTIVANPDFEKIKDSDFTQYYYEPFTETLKRYPSHDKVMEYYKKGIERGVFKPQFHGREHVNIRRWLSALRTGESSVRDAFHLGMFTLHVRGASSGRREFLDSFGGSSVEEQNSYHQILNEGLDLFEKLWGYRSKSFIAPCYTWPGEIEPILKNGGVEYIQGTHVQRIPQHDQTLAIRKKYHYMGQRNFSGQRYLLRNAFFEPCENPDINSVESCLNQIGIAFKWKRPAIISSHRVNYIGSIHRENREKNLKQLSILLQKVLERYSDVEFLSTDNIFSHEV